MRANSTCLITFSLNGRLGVYVTSSWEALGHIFLNIIIAKLSVPSLIVMNVSPGGLPYGKIGDDRQENLN